MKTAKKSISSASFTAQVFRLTINKLQQIIAVKWVGFTGFVLICIAFRYFMLMSDEDSAPKTNRVKIKNTYSKMEVWPAEVMLDQYLKARNIKFKLLPEKVKPKINN